MISTKLSTTIWKEILLHWFARKHLDKVINIFNTSSRNTFVNSNHLRFHYQYQLRQKNLSNILLYHKFLKFTVQSECHLTSNVISSNSHEKYFLASGNRLTVQISTCKRCNNDSSSIYQFDWLVTLFIRFSIFYDIQLIFFISYHLISGVFWLHVVTL